MELSGQPARPPGPLARVDDPNDDRLTDYRSLNQPVTRQRVEHEASIFVVEGKIAVGRLLSSSYRVRSLLIDDHQAEGAAGLIEAVRSQGAPVFVGSREVVAATVGFALHRGVVAVAHRPGVAEASAVMAEAARHPSAGGGRPLVAVLEGLNDHENIGSLFRNAAAFSVAAVFLDPTSADPLYRRSVRVSMGHILQVPFARLEPWPEAIDQVRAAGFVVAALSPRPRPCAEGDSRCLSLRQLVASGAGQGATPSPVALMLGAEGPGLSDRALSGADIIVSIPMAPEVDSLNVATAAAIAFQALSGPST